MLCLWVYLPSVQHALLTVCRGPYDNAATSNAATSNGDKDDQHGDKDDQHIDTRFGRVQVLLRTELGQLVVQMFMGLLYGVPTMCRNHNCNHHDHNGFCNNPISAYNSSISAGLQVLVRRQRSPLDKEVQMGKVRWLY